MKFGGFILVPDDGRVMSLDGQAVPLAPKPFETLQYLLRHPGRLVSKQELLEAVWPDTYITEDGLVQCVVDIRRALGDSAKAPQYIQTVPKRGYRLLVAVESSNTGTSDPNVLPSRRSDPQSPRSDSESAAAHSTAELVAVAPVPTGRASWIRRRVATAVAVLVLGLVAAAVWLPWTGSPREPAAYKPEPGLVVMLPVQMVDGLEDLGWLRTGLPEMTAAEITGTRGIRLAPRHRLDAALTRAGLKNAPIVSHADGLTLARELGAERLVASNIQRVNERFVLHASIVDVASGREEREFAVHGDRRSDLLDALAEFAHRLAEALGPSTAAAASVADSAAFPTTSLEAYRAYSEALHHEGLGGREESAEAEARLQEAIRLDPTFARAYVRLALVQEARRRWGYGTSDPRPAVRAARKLTGELPERDRLIVQGMACLLLDNHPPRALEAWTTLLKLYPTFAQEAGVPTLVAYTLMQQGHWPELILATETHVDAPAMPRSDRALLHSLLGRAFRKQGEFDRAIAHTKRATELWPTQAGPAVLRIRTMLGRILVDAGRADEAVDVFRAIAADGLADVLNVTDAAWGLYMAGRAPDAMDMVERAIRLDPSYGNAYHLRGWLRLAAGRPLDAASDFEQAYERTPVGFGVPEQGLVKGDVAALYYAGVAYSRAGFAPRAKETWKRVMTLCASAMSPKGAAAKTSPAIQWHASYYAALAGARLGLDMPLAGRLEGDDATYYLLRARLEASRHHQGPALDALRQAIALRVGDLQHIADDPNFEEFAGHPLFRQLVGRGGT